MTRATFYRRVFLVTATPATWFDHFLILKTLDDRGLNYPSRDTLGVVLRVMLLTKQISLSSYGTVHESDSRGAKVVTGTPNIYRENQETNTNLLVHT